MNGEHRAAHAKVMRTPESAGYAQNIMRSIAGKADASWIERELMIAFEAGRRVGRRERKAA